MFFLKIYRRTAYPSSLETFLTKVYQNTSPEVIFKQSYQGIQIFCVIPLFRTLSLSFPLIS